MYTEKERDLLHRRVKCIKDLKYPPNIGVVPAGSWGIIVDFGQTSGNPFVCWDDSKEITIVYEHQIEIGVKVENYIPESRQD